MNSTDDRSSRFSPVLRAFLAASFLASTLFCTSGCIVIPVGDLLKGPPLQEQVLQEGAGFFEKEKIAVIDISGVITAHESNQLLSSKPNSVAEIKARLDWARADGEVKAVVLRIASPGGEVTACDILHKEVLRFRDETKVPVVACIVDQGASGGYYIACAADVVMAHPTAIVGSIGVIVQSFDLSGLLSKIGVNVDPIKSSEKKDISSIFRSRTPEEREVLQKLVDDMYHRFIDVVTKGRPDLSREEVVDLADGRVISGIEAAEVKLVDRTGYLDDAVEEAGRLGKVSSPTVIRYTRKAQGGSNIYTHLGLSPVSSQAAVDFNLRWNPGMFPTTQFYYLWRP